MTSEQATDHITASFPTSQTNMPRLSTMTETPTFATIKLFREELEKNAMSIPTPQTELGHLRLVLDEREYEEASGGVPFVVPTDPGPSAPNPISDTTIASRRSTRLAASSTSSPTREGRDTSSGADVDAQYSMLPYTAAESIRIYNEKKAEFRRYKQASMALKNLIINSIDDEYIRAIKKPCTLYALVSPMDLIEHVNKNYGKITDKNVHQMRTE